MIQSLKKKKKKNKPCFPLQHCFWSLAWLIRKQQEVFPISFSSRGLCSHCSSNYQFAYHCSSNFFSYWALANLIGIVKPFFIALVQDLISIWCTICWEFGFERWADGILYWLQIKPVWPVYHPYISKMKRKSPPGGFKSSQAN